MSKIDGLDDIQLANINIPGGSDRSSDDGRAGVSTSMGMGDVAPILITSPHYKRSSSMAAGHGGFAGASFWSAVSNLSTSVIGAGIMGLPATMRVLGLPIGIIVLLMMGLITSLSLEFLVRTTTVQHVWSYSDLVNQQFGNPSRIVLDVSMLINNLGICTVYLIIIADVMAGTYSGNGVYQPGLLVQWNGGETAWWTSRFVVIIVTMLVFLLPLVLLRHVDSLQYTSALSVALAVVFVVITLIVAIIGLARGMLPVPSFLPDLSNTSGVFAIFAVIPIMATAYVCHFNVHPIYVELRDRNEGTMLGVTRTSIVLCTVIYLLTATSGYLLFGSSTATDVLVNYGGDIPWLNAPAVNDVVRITYVLHIIFVFPVIFFSLRNITDDLIFPNSATPLIEDNRRFYILTGVYLFMVYLFSVVIPNLWMAFDITGATTTMLIGMLFPALLALKDKTGIISKRENYAAYFMVGLAIVVSITGVISSIYYIAYGKAGEPSSQQQT